jgi:Tol biopolymer transport system component
MSSKPRDTNSPIRPNAVQLASSPAFIIAVLVAGALIGAGVYFIFAGTGGADDKNKASVKYVNKNGEDAAQSVIDSPLTVKVRMPWLDGTPSNMVSGITLQLLDENGQPAEFGGRRTPLPMRATVEIETWEYVGSVPSKPGTYHAQVEILPFATDAQTQTLDLREPPLRAITGDAPPLTSGYVLAREKDLWMLSTDASRERRLTFLTPSSGGEEADGPAWSPDGKTIAFSYSPTVARGEVPRAEIWAIDPDGSNPRQVVAHGPNEVLYWPAWSADGKYLYFTVETSVNDPAIGQRLTYSTDRVEVATGVRSKVAESGEMAASSGPGGDIVFLDSVPIQEGSTSSIGQRLVIAEADGSGKRTVVPENVYPTLYAPRVSPDGKWLVFASVDENIPTPGAGFDLFKWLMLEPETASAHGIPWELYIVPTAGGTPAQLTHLSDDEPYPVWHDNSTLSFLGIKGLHTLQIDAQGKAIGNPQWLGEGIQHGKLTWHGP